MTLISFAASHRMSQMVCDGVSSNFNEGNEWTRANYPDPLTVMARAAPPPPSPSGIFTVAFSRVRDHLMYEGEYSIKVWVPAGAPGAVIECVNRHVAHKNVNSSVG